jgi:hypothetical protein
MEIGVDLLTKSKTSSIKNMPKARIFTSQPMLIKVRDPKKIHKADLEFEEIDRFGQSYEARIFLNNPKASHDTQKTVKNGYAGSFHLFGHGGLCLGGLAIAKFQQDQTHLT